MLRSAARRAGEKSSGVEVAALLVVGEADIVYTVVEEQARHLVFLSFIIHGYGRAALLFHEGHAGDVGDSVAEVDHIAVGNEAVVHLVVDLLVVGLVVRALGDAEDILRLLRIVDGYLRPLSLSLLVEVVLAGKDLLELVRATITVQ